MADISIQQFRSKAVGDGDLRLDNRETGLEKKGTWLGGKIVQWLREQFKGDTVRAENKAVMESFFKSLKGEYGDVIGDRMKAQLQRAYEAGKPLSARSVRTIVADADMQKNANQTANIRTGWKYSDTRLAWSLGGVKSGQAYYGNLYDKIAADLGVYGEVYRLRDAGDADAMKSRIRQSITEASRGGKYKVPDETARDLATYEITKFVMESVPKEKLGQLDLGQVDGADLKKLSSELKESRSDLHTKIDEEIEKRKARSQKHLGTTAKSLVSNLEKKQMDFQGLALGLRQFMPALSVAVAHRQDFDEKKETGTDDVNSLRTRIFKKHMGSGTNLEAVRSSLDSGKVKQLFNAFSELVYHRALSKEPDVQKYLLQQIHTLQNLAGVVQEGLTDEKKELKLIDLDSDTTPLKDLDQDVKAALKDVFGIAIGGDGQVTLDHLKKGELIREYSQR